MEPWGLTPITRGSYQALFDTLPGALVVLELSYDPAGQVIERKILEVNAAFEKFFNLKRDALLGTKTAAVFPCCQAGWFSEHGPVLRAGKSTEYVTFCEKMGRWYDVRILPLEQGEQCAIIFCDITEEREDARRRAENETRQTYLLALDNILNTLDGAEAIQKGAIDLLCKHFGICQANFVECNDDCVLASCKSERDLRVPIRRQNKQVAYLTVTSHKGRIWSEDEVDLMRATAQRTWLALTKARAQEALRESEQTAVALLEQLKATDGERNEMLSILSHELRNPMAVIAAGLDLLELNNENGEVQSSIDIMRGQIEQLITIVDDLRNLAYLSANILKLEKKRTDLRTVVVQVVQGLDSSFQKKAVKLAYSLPTEPVLVNIDPARIGQGLEQILLNALRFSPQDGTIKLALQCSDANALVQVKDEGPGIPFEVLENVFEPFVKGGRPRQRPVTGRMGVGLTIVRGIFLKHDGWVEACNAGTGALFTLGLPLDGGANSGEETDTPNLQILCIEDNIELAQMLQRIFVALGHETNLAHTGMEGLKKAGELKPDVIFCDLGLEDITGFDVAKKLKANAELKDIFLVALTGYTSKKDKERAEKSGFDVHVAKPFKIATIEEILARILLEKE